MRVFEFRAWYKGEMLYDVYPIKLAFANEVVRPQENWWYYLQDTVEEVEAIMQYIGLEDKNGVKIFEGDILKCVDEGESSSIHKVCWGGYDYPAFELEPSIGDGMNCFSELVNYDWDFEVIGNIYENKDLLTKGK